MKYIRFCPRCRASIADADASCPCGTATAVAHPLPATLLLASTLYLLAASCLTLEFPPAGVHSALATFAALTSLGALLLRSLRSLLTLVSAAFTVALPFVAFYELSRMSGDGGLGWALFVAYPSVPVAVLGVVVFVRGIVKTRRHTSAA